MNKNNRIFRRAVETDLDELCSLFRQLDNFQKDGGEDRGLLNEIPAVRSNVAGRR